MGSYVFLIRINQYFTENFFVIIKVKETLALFKQKFSEVFYIPGNHDLWLVSEEEKGNGEYLIFNI